MIFKTEANVNNVILSYETDNVIRFKDIYLRMQKWLLAAKCLI